MVLLGRVNQILLDSEIFLDRAFLWWMEMPGDATARLQVQNSQHASSGSTATAYFEQMPLHLRRFYSKPWLPTKPWNFRCVVCRMYIMSSNEIFLSLYKLNIMCRQSVCESTLTVSMILEEKM